MPLKFYRNFTVRFGILIYQHYVADARLRHLPVPMHGHEIGGDADAWPLKFYRTSMVCGWNVTSILVLF